MPQPIQPSPFPKPTLAQDASPDSLVARLRSTAAQKRETEELTVELPGRWQGVLRARYGMVRLELLEQYTNAQGSAIGMSLDILAHACKAIEAYDEDEHDWVILKDERGPVSFDDRLARLLGWPRPAEEFEFSSRQVYETMFDENGLAISAHVAKVAGWMGATEEQIGVGESTGGGSTRSVPPSPTG